jgi:RHS repeat-associated protein
MWGNWVFMAEANGLYYMRARYYDPEVGRFISEDPLGFDGGGVNLYVYGGNNPVLMVDPSGLDYFLANPSTGMLSHFNDDGYYGGSYPYTSGRNGVTDPSIPWQGPTPAGNYTINPSEISKAGIARKLMNFFGITDWGDYRASLHPDEGTNTYGRSGFFLHGGELPGSAGCIDIGTNDKLLFPTLQQHQGAIHVQVMK